ncbi:Crp/Fnr family transcriptional regulator [Clostridium sp. JS66]|uniref:Crp/Fnr family transcriptional regulator n=1 Tax=Clostridium sp. JS66 TaxID=3064705 RepID=UPI00298E354D|nr:Crp/Fnr family transcriptional regulator [Clostridium sp. JS66]WPC40652.1 Crp/Fnr family transcriptional regulator [Clostridium sp. JS66]
MIKATEQDFNQISIFNCINERTLELLKAKAFKVKLKKGELLFYEKQKVNKIYLVLHGRVTMYRNSEEGQKRVVYILGDGDFVNEVIFDDLPASINCEAFQESCILCFYKKDLLEIMAGDFQLTRTIINSMARKIRRLYRQLKNTVPIKMDKKLSAKLWKLCKDYGVEVEEGTLIDMNISITYLADMLGSTRETISRCMKGFEKSGMLKFIGKKILVRDPKELSIYFRGRE